MKHFITQHQFEDLMADQAGSNTQHQQASRVWAMQMAKMIKDGGILQSPDNSFPTLTKVAAQKGWTFDA